MQKNRFNGILLKQKVAIGSYLDQLLHEATNDPLEQDAEDKIISLVQQENLEDGLCARLIQIGIRTATDHQRQQAERFGIETVEARSVDRFNPGAILGPIYVTVDLDGLDPAFAPGVSHQEPGGLTTRQLFDLLAALQGPIVGADIVELNPRRDVVDMTAIVAAKLLKELAAHLMQ